MSETKEWCVVGLSGGMTFYTRFTDDLMKWSKGILDKTVIEVHDNCVEIGMLSRGYMTLMKHCDMPQKFDGSFVVSASNISYLNRIKDGPYKDGLDRLVEGESSVQVPVIDSKLTVVR